MPSSCRCSKTVVHLLLTLALRMAYQVLGRGFTVLRIAFLQVRVRGVLGLTLPGLLFLGYS
jgi:hypothetical protein